MHFKQKLIFMALGSILTLAGYLLATLTSDVTAQNNETNLGDIICDSITIRDGQIEIVDENNRSTLIHSTGMEIFDGTSPRIKIYYETDADAGMVVLANPKKNIGCLIHPGEISLVKGLSYRPLSIHHHGIIFEDESGDPRMLIYHEPESNDTGIMIHDKPETGNAMAIRINKNKANITTFENKKRDKYLHKH